MEEVNSHVDHQFAIMKQGISKPGSRQTPERFPITLKRLKAYENCDYILCPSEFVRKSFISKDLLRRNYWKWILACPTINRAQPRSSEWKSVSRVVRGPTSFPERSSLMLLKPSGNWSTWIKTRNRWSPRWNNGLEKTQIPEGVIFTGTLKGEELNNEYRKASVFILPSLEEGLALVQLEALSFGLPCWSLRIRVTI